MQRADSFLYTNIENRRPARNKSSIFYHYVRQLSTNFEQTVNARPMLWITLRPHCEAAARPPRKVERDAHKARRSAAFRVEKQPLAGGAGGGLMIELRLALYYVPLCAAPPGRSRWRRGCRLARVWPSAAHAIK